MRKILIAFDGSQYSEAALAFASRLNENDPVTVIGVFLPLTDITSYWSYAGSNGPQEGAIPLVEKSVAATIRNNMKRFENYCIDHGIDYRVHTDYFDLAIPELKKESRFADLLIINSDSFYANAAAWSETYLEEALHSMECPVLLVPDHFEFPIFNILSYDGSFSSVHAIKQFAYLLPELAHNDTTLVHADPDRDKPFPDELNIENLVSRHFGNHHLFKFEADPQRYFSTWLANTKSAILVSGSFGGSSLYRLFHESFVSDILSQHKVPIFIAHK